MKLMRIGPEGAERPALLADGGVVLDPPGLRPDIDGASLAAGGIDRVRRGVSGATLPRLEAARERVCAPVARPGNPYLPPGDLVELEITGLGAQTQTLAEA